MSRLAITPKRVFRLYIAIKMLLSALKYRLNTATKK